MSSKNPAPRRKQGKAPFVAEDVFDEVLASIDGRHFFRNRALMLVSYNMGLRAMEIAGLKIKDVLNLQGDLKETVALRKETTKGKKFREVPLVHSKTRAALETYLADYEFKSREDALFLSQKGDHFLPKSMARLITSLFHRASVEASSHSGRRSYATRLIERGADVYAIKTLMGHSSIMTTQEYFSSSAQRLKTVAGLLE